MGIEKWHVWFCSIDVDHLFISAMLDQWIAFPNLVPTLPTMPLSDITGGD